MTMCRVTQKRGRPFDIKKPKRGYNPKDRKINRYMVDDIHDISDAEQTLIRAQLIIARRNK
jgi:hypothetical protein